MWQTPFVERDIHNTPSPISAIDVGCLVDIKRALHQQSRASEAFFAWLVVLCTVYVPGEVSGLFCCHQKWAFFSSHFANKFRHLSVDLKSNCLPPGPLSGFEKCSEICKAMMPYQGLWQAG